MITASHDHGKRRQGRKRVKEWDSFVMQERSILEIVTN
jgi:hypothetical protein